MRTTAYLFAGLLLAAALTPVVLGAPERGEPRRGDMERLAHAQRAEKRAWGNATDVTFSADGMDRRNNTYDLSGLGSLDCRSRENETRGTLKVVCRGRLNATLVDANGTLVKEGTIALMLHAHKNETGAWTWHMVSVGHGKRHGAIVMLHGDAATQTGDQLSLEGGKGLVVVKKHGDDPRLRLRLSDGQVGLASI